MAAVEKLAKDHEEERLAWETQLRTERANVEADLERELGTMAADREAERAGWALERERLREEAAADLEQERVQQRQRLTAVKEEHDMALSRAEALRQAALQEHALQLEEAGRRASQQVALAVREKGSQEERLAHAERELEEQMRLNEVLQDRVLQLQGAADAAAKRAGDMEADMQAAVSGLEEKLRRGAEERRALEIASSSLKLEIQRKTAAHQRLLQVFPDSLSRARALSLSLSPPSPRYPPLSCSFFLSLLLFLSLLRARALCREGLGSGGTRRETPPEATHVLGAAGAE